jgi:S-adenosylmethionine:tRNA ribosyltransferase-isomerase
VRPGSKLDAIGMTVRVGADLGDGRREVVLDHHGQDEVDLIEANGVVPLPPYIQEPLDDPERYQTTYARPDARSVAAPTAGLHLTREVLQRCVDAGAQVVALELEVGLGTFRPITTDRVEDHDMHHERYRIPPDVFATCTAADRVIAVGTTVVRALESAAANGLLEGDTDLFIQRGFDFRVVDRLLTNFHVPRSSLLVLLDAFVGVRWRQLYEDALEHGFRFLSFGDAMLVDRAHAPR